MAASLWESFRMGYPPVIPAWSTQNGKRRCRKSHVLKRHSGIVLRHGHPLQRAQRAREERAAPEPARMQPAHAASLSWRLATKVAGPLHGRRASVRYNDEMSGRAATC